MNISQSTARIMGMNELGEQVTASAAKISTTKGNSLEVFQNSTDTLKNRKLINKVLASGHQSLIEHIVFNIAFCNVSAIVEQFFIEFRLASFTIKSRRYVDFSDSGYYVPTCLEGESKEIYTNHIEHLFSEYNYFIENGIPKEDARFVLPYCFNSNFYCTVNARELIHILRRMIYGLDYSFAEIKDLGKQILFQLQSFCPSVYDAFSNMSENTKEFDEPIFSNQEFENQEYKKNVEIINVPNSPEKLLLSAASLSKRIENNSTADLISNIIKSSRPRELEQLSYTFKFNNISLSAITHIARHRIQSLIVPPLFSVNLTKYIIPKSIKDRLDLNDRYINIFNTSIKVSNDLKYRGVSSEILTYLNLSGNTLDILTTMNARELQLFFKLRTCNRAQWEIQEFAIDLLNKLRDISPTIFRNMGPSCFCNGVCPEGKLTCGKMKEMINAYQR